VPAIVAFAPVRPWVVVCPGVVTGVGVVAGAPERVTFSQSGATMSIGSA
jgi:hypothetical protein